MNTAFEHRDPTAVFLDSGPVPTGRPGMTEPTDRIASFHMVLRRDGEGEVEFTARGWALACCGGGLGNGSVL